MNRAKLLNISNLKQQFDKENTFYKNKLNSIYSATISTMKLAQEYKENILDCKVFTKVKYLVDNYYNVFTKISHRLFTFTSILDKLIKREQEFNQLICLDHGFDINFELLKVNLANFIENYLKLCVKVGIMDQ